MENEKRNSSSDALHMGLSAAHAVRGAAKTGRAAAGAAKGVAAGGPYGAAVGALWEGGRHLGKAAAAVAVLLLLPVLYVAMLPGLLYDGLVSPSCPADPGTPVLNSGTAVMENVNTITLAINSVLEETLGDTLAEIADDFAASGGDGMEVINPYASGSRYNANLFVAQYCAFRAGDYGAVSIADMEEALRGGRAHLYSYGRREERRERMETDPVTGEETVVAEKWMVYTVSYNGESYFAERVFALTEGQKALAADYAQNMSLFLGDGLLQSPTGKDGDTVHPLGDVCFRDGAVEVAYFNQKDERYAGRPYGTDHIGGYGCGPTCMAMVVSSLTGEYLEPTEMAQWSYENGYWCEGGGSYHALIPDAAANWGLPVSGCTASEPQRILDALADGKLVVAIMSKGHFTRGGHFIVLRGVRDGKVLVADPASYGRSEQAWDLSVILDEASRRTGAGGPFWIIG